MYHCDNNELVVDETVEITNKSIDGRFHFIGKCLLEKGVRIGYNTSIENSSIARNVIIWSNCNVFDSCRIGANSIIYHNCVIGCQTTLGANVRLNSNTFVSPYATIGDSVYIAGGSCIGWHVDIGRDTQLDIVTNIPDNARLSEGTTLESLNQACIQRLRIVGETHLFTKWTDPDRTTTFAGIKTVFRKGEVVEVTNYNPSHVQCAGGLHVCVPGCIPYGVDITGRIPLVVRVHVDDILHAGYFNIGPKVRVRKLEVLT